MVAKVGSIALVAAGICIAGPATLVACIFAVVGNLYGSASPNDLLTLWAKAVSPILATVWFGSMLAGLGVQLLGDKNKKLSNRKVWATGATVGLLSVAFVAAIPTVLFLAILFGSQDTPVTMGTWTSLWPYGVILAVSTLIALSSLLLLFRLNSVVKTVDDTRI